MLPAIQTKYAEVPSLITLMEIIPSFLTAWVTKTVKSSRSQCFKTANAFRAIVVTTGGSNVDDASAHKRSPSLCRKAVFLQETREKALAKLLTSIVSNSSRLCSTKCCAKSSKLSEPHLEVDIERPLWDCSNRSWLQENQSKGQTYRIHALSVIHSFLDVTMTLWFCGFFLSLTTHQAPELCQGDGHRTQVFGRCLVIPGCL